MDKHPDPDWTKVPVDTLVEAQHPYDKSWTVRHFAFYNPASKKVFVWGDGRTSIQARSAFAWDIVRLKD